MTTAYKELETKSSEKWHISDCANVYIWQVLKRKSDPPTYWNFSELGPHYLICVYIPSQSLPWWWIQFNCVAKWPNKKHFSQNTKEFQKTGKPSTWMAPKEEATIPGDYPTGEKIVDHPLQSDPAIRNSIVNCKIRDCRQKFQICFH